MKKILSLVLAVLLCGLSTSVWAERVSKDEAAQLAGQFFSAKVQTAKNVKKAAPASTSAVLNAKQVASAQQLQVKGGNLLPMQSGAVMNKAASATLTPATKAIDNGVVSTKVLELPKSLEIDQFYIVQEEDEDGGWVIMAADDAVKPILGYCDKGTFDPSAEMPENLKWWLGMYNRQIKRAVDLKQEATDDVKAEWTELRRGVRRATAAVVVGPLLETTWDQGTPYNYLCPTYSGSTKSATGCVATAMSQVMNFWEWPTTGQGSHGGINFANTTYDWANMKNSYGSYSSAQRDAVATLMYHVGMSIDMSYGASSGAYTINFGNTSLPCAQNSLSDYFKYNYDSIKSYYREGYKGTIRVGSTTCNANYASWTDANWIAMLKTELDKHRPIMYDGSGDGGGHSFVCDGYRSDNYFHFNWGWGGSYDGYFTVNNLAPEGGGTGSNNDNTFNEGQGVIIGIVPNVSDKYKVTYSVENGTLIGNSTWTQSTVGQSCTLPNVTPNDNYRFIGWTDLAGSKIANVGQAGDTYTPMRNVTLYAVTIQEASLVYFVSDIVPDSVYGNVYFGAKPSWSGHGFCEVNELYEDGEGTGVVLPSVISEAGWTMQEWLIYSGGLYIAGWPGDTFYPSKDTVFLFAYWTPNGKVYLDEELTGVVATAGPFDDLSTTYGWITQADGLNATFVAAEYFETLTAENTTVSVKVGDEAINNCYSFANGVLTISLTSEQLTEDIEIAIRATAADWNCDSYSYTYQSSQGTGTKTLGDYSWTISAAGGTSASFNSSAQRFGSTRSKSTSVTYTTTNPSNCLINNIKINTWCTSDGGTLEVWIGNTSLGTATLTSATADYTFTNPDLLKGQVKFVVTNASSSRSYYIYVQSINITMADYPDGGLAPQAPIKVNADFIYANRYNYNEEDETLEPDWDWFFQIMNTNGDYAVASTSYPYVYIQEDAAPSATALTGTHNPYILALFTASSTYNMASTLIEPLVLTYKNQTTIRQTYNGNTYNITYYIYHATLRWSDATGQEYYVDSDVYAYIYDDEGDEVVTPTGDTDPRYYRADFYQQDVSGEGYTLYESVTGQGESGDVIEVTRKSYAGFKTPAAQTITLVNSNTQSNPAVVSYYYDRRTYPISFVVENIEIARDTVRYKATPVYSGPTPEREATAQHSYAFTGWIPVLAPITQATTYTAQFTEVTYVTVTFNANGHGTAPQPLSVIQGQPVANPGDLTALGYTFGGWFTDSECLPGTAWDFSNPVNADMTLYAKWTINTHKLRWNSNGGVLTGGTGGIDTDVQVAYGTSIQAPSASRDGYTFAGWNGTVPATMPDNDVELTAQWTANTNTPYKVKHYQQNIDDDNYTLIDTDNLTGTSDATVTPETKNYVGFTAPAAQEVTIAADGSLVVTYNYTRNVHTLTWNANGGTISGNAHTSGNVKFGKTIVAPANANVTKVGCSFLGWDPASVPATMPDNDLTFTAQWELQTFNVSVASADPTMGGVSINPNKSVFEYGETATVTATAEDGYLFDGWNDGNTDNPRTITVTGAVSLTANFVADDHVLYVVHHFQQNILDDGWTEILPVDNLYGTTGTLTNVAPAVKNYEGFDVEPYSNVTIAGDGSTEVNIYYIRQTFVIRFLVDGVVKQEETLRYGATPAWKFAEPTKDADAQFSYDFDGWDPAISTVKAAQDYNAKWDSILIFYTVSFYNNGHGGNTAQQSIGYGYKVTEPEALSETGWTFGGWYKEAGCINAWNFATDVVNGPTTLYAKWTVNKHNLEWITDGDALTGDYTRGEVAFGTAITQPNTPTKTGYVFSRWNGEVLPIPGTMPDRDLSYTAEWNPATHTQYIVKHLQQNVAGTDYEEVVADRQTLYGTTEDIVTPAVKTYSGFDSPATQSEAILADGSLVIEYRYDRKSFTLTWEVNGGDALVDNGYTRGSVKFGAEITAPANPTWTGYTFTEWQPEVPATMPANNLTLVAQWTEYGETPYTVKHFKQNLDLTYNAEPDAIDNLKGKTNASVTPGVKTFTGFSAPATQTANILSDGSLVIEYRYTRNTYNLSWDANGGDLGSGFSNGAILFDDDITAPVPTREGYGFNNWDGTVPAKMPANDLSFKAQWIPNTNTAYVVKHYQQNIDDDEFTLVETENLTGTSDAKVTPAVIAYEGFTAPTPEEVTIAADGSLVVVYEYTRDKYQLTWNAGEGTLVDNGYTRGSVKFGKQILAPANPTWRGHTFQHWDKTIPTNMPADDLTLTAQWTTDTYTGITFKTEDATEGKVTVDPDKDSYTFGESVTITAEANEGYHFTGWSDGNTENPRTIVIDETTQSLTATFAPNTDTRYTVLHYLQNINDDNFDILYRTDNQTGTTGALIQDSPLEITGFLTPGSQINQVAIAGDGSTVITYKYVRNTYNLTWNANGGNIAGEYTNGDVKFEAQITAPANANVTRDGYSFKGWDPATIPATMPANALTFKAVWEANEVSGVSFTSEDNEKGTVTVTPAQDIYHYDDVVTITAEANDGYTFSGWSDGNTDASRTITIDENTGAIVAIFTPNTNTRYVVRRYKQHVDDDEFGFFDEEEHFGTTGTEVAPEPAEIVGFATPAAISAKIAGNGGTIITYNYVRNKYNLTWNANGGNIAGNYSNGEVKFEAPISAPANENVTRVGHTFLGWDPATIPATMPAEALTFKAQWEANVIDGVSFTSEDSEKGTVSVSPSKDEYKYGDVVTVTAEANDGYHFVGWSDGNTDNPRTITVDENTGAIVAIFAPNEDTKFHIHVLLQNIDDDEFTLSKDIEATGITGTTVAPEPELIEGFETPDVVSATIKGDGTTVIEQRYIRKKFELVWNTDGGDFGECEYTHGEVKFGANIIAPADPVKAHFIFIGWDQEIPETMPAENVTITALWEADPTGIEVVVDGRTIIGNDEIRIYDINGRDVTGWNGNLGRGFYIVVSGGVATKVAIQ